jgi:uncharacterized protein YggE
MHRRDFAALFLLSASIAGPAHSQGAAPPVIVTSGSASLAIPPTGATIHFRIDTRGATASAASTENGARQRRLAAMVQRQQLTGAAITIGRFWVEANTARETDSILFYEASADVALVLPELGRLGPLVDSALKSGATAVNQIVFTSDSLSSARARALTQALHAAQHDAQALAVAAGGSLGALLQVSTMPFEQPVTAFAAMQSGVSSSGGFQDIGPSEVRVEVTVYAKWLLGEGP